MANATEIMVEELDMWTKVIQANAHLIARAVVSNSLGPIVLTFDIKDVGGEEEAYGVQWDCLSQTEHSN